MSINLRHPSIHDQSLNSFCGQSNANLISILDRYVNLGKIVNPVAIDKGFSNLGNNPKISQFKNNHWPISSTISVNPESIQCQFLANRRTFVQATRELVYYRDRQLVSAVDDYTPCPFKAALTQCQGQTSNQRPFHRQSTNVIPILDQSTNPSQSNQYFTLSN